jgi:hypothetical protein
VAAAGDGDPARELGHGRAVLVFGHDRCRQIEAEKHFSFLDFAVDVAVSPAGLGVGAAAGLAGRDWPRPGLDVGPVHGQRGAAVFVRLGDAGFGQLVAQSLQAG